MHNRPKHIFILLFYFVSLSSCQVFKAISFGKKMSKVKVVGKHYASVTMPFELVNNQIVIHTIIDHDGEKIPVSLMLDTGGPTLLSEKFAKAHGIVMENIADVMEIPMVGAPNENNKQGLAKKIGFQLGSIKVMKPHLFIFNFDSSFYRCRNIDGLLGSDVLSRFGLFVNFEEKTVTFFNKRSKPDSFNTYPTALRFKPRIFMKNPMVKMTINSIDIKYLWDLGFTGTFLVQYPSAEEQNFSDKLKRIEHVTYDIYGATADAKGLDTVHKHENAFIIKQVTQDETTVLFPEKSIAYVENMKRNDVHANVGIDFMKHFNVFFDWKSKKIFLKRNSNTSGISKLPDYLGNYDAAKDEFYIAKVNTQSELYNNGLRAGAIIKSIDGTEVNTLFDKQNICNIGTQFAIMLRKAHSNGVYEGGTIKNYQLK